MADDIRIATYALGQVGGTPQIAPYHVGAIYSIDDLNPWLCIGFAKKPAAIKKVGKFDQHPIPPTADLTWWRWQPIAPEERQIGRLRRYGHYRMELHEPRRLTLQCYVWPGRFFDPLRYQAMLAEIEHEFGRPIEWERSDAPVRSRVVPTRGQPSDAELFQTIQYELGAVHALERSGALADPAAELHETTFAISPETRLVAMWAWRRQADLVQLRRRQARIAAAHGVVPGDANQARAAHRRAINSTALAAVRDGERLAAQVSRIASLHHHELSSFELSPAMQRDHRLRRLVRAFAPVTREHWAAISTPQMSTSPPLKAPDVFELWGVARLVCALSALGWTVVQRVCTDAAFASMREPHLVELSKGKLVLSLEHNPVVHKIDCSAAPPMHVRRMALVEWANANVPGPDGLVAAADLTPDYVLRLSSVDDGPLALAIGDATLSDPKYGSEIEDGSQGNMTKAEKMITYRERVGWRVRGRLIRCTPACTFVILPGPTARWTDVMSTSGVDSVLLFPDPGTPEDLDFTEGVGAIIESMQAAAGGRC